MDWSLKFGNNVQAKPKPRIWIEESVAGVWKQKYIR